MLVDDLKKLPEESLQDIRAAANKAENTLMITSAYDMDESRRTSLQDTLKAVMGRDLSCEFKTDSRILAGARVSVGAWTMQATLRDELSAFAEASNGFN
jgi:F-type H+-transporting ATPase subunit b